jgi:hypothetical protein
MKSFAKGELKKAVTPENVGKAAGFIRGLLGGDKK